MVLQMSRAAVQTLLQPPRHTYSLLTTCVSGTPPADLLLWREHTIRVGHKGEVIQVSHKGGCIQIPYFLEMTQQLLLISVLPQCGVYSRAALNRGRRLIPLRVLTTCNLVPSTFTRQFPADAMTDREECFFVCSFMCTSLLGSSS